MHLVLKLFCIGALVGLCLAGEAAGLRPVPVAHVGYIRADANPERNSCTEFDPGSSVAWDYGNRSLVIELAKPGWVTSLVVTSTEDSAHAPKLRPGTVSLYTSNDNITYQRYPAAFAFTLTRSARPGEVWRARFADLGFFARFIKLKQTYNGADYGFGITNLKEAVQVLTDNDLQGNPGFMGMYLEPAQPTGQITAWVHVKGAGAEGLSVELAAENTETWQVTTGQVPAKPGQWAPATLSSPQLRQGGYWVTVRLRYRDSVVDERRATCRVHTQVVDDVTSAGDLPQLQPGGSLVLRDLPRWCQGGEPFEYTLPHRSKATCRGLALPAAGTLTLNLPLTGEYAVYFAADSPWPDVRTQWGSYQGEIAAAQTDWPTPSGTQEHFVGCSDFSQGPLVVTTPLTPLRVQYLRVTRLTPEESDLIHHQPDPTHNRRVIYNNDGFSELWGVKGWDRKRLLKLVERYEGTDTEIFEMAALVSGWVNYPSKYATFWRTGEVPDSEWVRANDRMAVELFNQLEADGNPIFQTLAQRGHELGIAVFGSLRMSGYYPLQEEQTMQPFNGKLWHEHPEMRVRRRDGGYDPQMSFAWEAVRNERLGVLREFLQMGCDGISMDFCRYPDILGYDEPWVEGFKQKYGVNPLDLPEGDERWINYRCEQMNDFFRQVRKQTDEIGRQQGRTLRIAIRVPATGYREYGFDPQTWTKERLMDIFIPHYPGLERDFDVRPWVAMVKGTGIKVYPGIEITREQTSNTELTDAEIARGIKPGIETYMSRDDYQRKVWQRYRQGADGVFLFNTWTIGVERNLLGDKRSLQRWSYFEDPMNLPRQSGK